MDKEDNPYMNLIGIMRHQGSMNNPIPYQIGVVISTSPLLIQLGAIQLERQEILINESLLKGYQQKVKLQAQRVTGNVATEHGGTLTSFIMSEGTVENLEDSFSVGDKLVLLVSQDQQQVVVVAKVR